MTADQLRSALARDGHQISNGLLERVVDALTGPPGGAGMPDLDFLPAGLQVAVLAALYRDFIGQVSAALRPPAL